MEIKLLADNVTQAIANLPEENRFRPPTPPHHADDSDHTVTGPNTITNTNPKDIETDVPSNNIMPQSGNSSSTANTPNSDLSGPLSPNKNGQQAKLPPQSIQVTEYSR